MRTLRGLIMICGALLTLGALGFLIFLPDSLRDYSREPEDVWLQTGWAILLGLLAVSCFIAVRSIGRKFKD